MRFSRSPFDADLVNQAYQAWDAEDRDQERTVQAGRKSMLLGAPEQRAAELLDRWRAERPDDRSWTGLHPAS